MRQDPERERCIQMPRTAFPVIPPDHLDLPRPLPIDFLGGNQPLPPLPKFPTIPYVPPKPLPLLTIRLQLIATTNQFPIDPQRFVPVLPGLNAFFAPARIEFVFDPVIDFLQVDDFQLDQDFELVEVGSLTNPENDRPAEDWSRFHAVRQAMAKSHHGKLVIFVRRGTRMDWDPAIRSWVLNDHTDHFSGSLGDFVATCARYWQPAGSTPIDANTLAHEIGHYLHLPHTMLEMPNSIVKAADVLRTAVEVWGWNANDADKIFDADAPFIADTPPDPGPDLLKVVNAGDPCGNANFVDVPVTFTNGTQRTYRLQPDRTNLMSYFKGCSGSHGFSPVQIRRMRVAIEHGNRQHLLTGRDVFVPSAPVANHSGNGPSVFVLDVTQSPWYLPWTGHVTSIAPGWIWLGGYFASIAAATDSFGAIHVVARDFSGHVFYRSLPVPIGRPAPAWRQLGRATFAGNPVVIVRAPNHVELFGRDDSGALQWQTVDPTGRTSSWQSLGGNCIGVPAACSWDANRIDVVARQADLTFAHNFWNGTQWSGWRTLGPLAGHDPVLVASASGRLDLVLRDVYGRIDHRRFLNGQWGANWSWLGGAFTGTPSVVASSPDRLDIITRGTDGALWHRRWDGSGWTPAMDWRPLGGRTVESPSACASANVGAGRRLDIFARQPDGGVLHSLLDTNDAQEPGPLSWSTLVCPAIV